jgi:hypothetical protein
MHQSIATIDSPEFINLQPLDINPLMSKCEIKVLYVGENRNHSFITKEVATEMSKTLRGAPIVGYYKEDKGDFRDHGDQIIINEEGIQFNCLTKPYGFVAPDAQVWFQKFEDEDDFGNKIVREYLMTTGFLWTGQFEEAKLAIEEGRPHSMELDDKTINGYWSENINTHMEMFIINDAIFSKLCILGNDVEPCFEGSNVKAPEVSTEFTKVDDNFKQTLFNMMQELKFALKGGNMAKLDDKKDGQTVVDTDNKTTEKVNDNSTNKEEKKSEEEKKEKYAKEEKKEEKKEESENKPTEEKEKEEEKEESKDYALMYSELTNQYNTLSEQYNELVHFKNSIEREKKEQLIDGFYMLSDEDKQDVISNIDKYSLDDIEAKLSVICVRKKVNFDLEDTSKNENKEEEDKPANTYNLNDAGESVPAWIKAIKNHK